MRILQFIVVSKGTSLNFCLRLSSYSINFHCFTLIHTCSNLFPFLKLKPLNCLCIYNANLQGCITLQKLESSKTTRTSLVCSTTIFPVVFMAQWSLDFPVWPSTLSLVWASCYSWCLFWLFLNNQCAGTAMMVPGSPKDNILPPKSVKNELWKCFCAQQAASHCIYYVKQIYHFGSTLYYSSMIKC